MNGTVRPSATRGHGDFGWLDSRHSFSFGEYHDPRYAGFGVLRVINEDRVAGRGGFPLHPHRDMEIFSYVVSGRLQHADSLGFRETIGPGQVQRISAGRGIRHSEFNPSPDEPVHFLQIWIEPRERGLEPAYGSASFPDLGNGWQPLVSPDGRAGSLVIQQDAVVLAAKPSAGTVLRHATEGPRALWVQVVKGRVSVGGKELGPGDAWHSGQESGTLEITAAEDAELLLFELPPLGG